jgi:hypothetical protein
MSEAVVFRYLAARNIAFAVIGARAMGIRGVLRFSDDTDLLTTNRDVLHASFWSELEDADVDVRRGEFDDPLAGVATVTIGDEAVDVVVGKYKWQAAVVQRAERAALGDETWPVVRAADLILLKLFAGGPQDAWDIEQLLRTDPTLRSVVEEHLAELPEDARQLWQRFA